MPELRAVGVALFAALLVAPAAHANFPASVETTVVPGGTSTIGSPPLSPTMKSATVDIAPAKPNDEQFFDNMRVVLSLQPTPGKRLLLCIGLYINVAHGIDESAELQFPAEVHPLAVLLLSACLEQAAELDRAAQQPPQATTSVVAKCHQIATQIGATFTRVGRKYRATIHGRTTTLKRRGRLKVTCKRKGKGLTLKVRPTAKRASLRSVVGPRLQVGVYNPLQAKGAGRLKLTFRK